MNKRDQQRFDEIRHRLERVTPGPWSRYGQSVIVAMLDTPEEVVIAITTKSVDQDGANADFLAHSLDDVTWLTERVRDLERALASRPSDTQTAPDGP